MLQRSKDWYEIRRGKFTASPISRLLGKEGLAKTRESIENYAFEKAVEIVFGLDEEDDFTSFDMRRGIELEPIAFRKFKELKFLCFIDVNEATFFPYGKNAGASPDGLVGEDCLEIKCPRPTKFFKIVAKGIEAIDSEYYDQMQFQMLCTKSSKCYFFNYIIFNGKEYWHEIIVPRNESRIEFIKTRINEAVLIRDRFIKQLQTNKQF